MAVLGVDVGGTFTDAVVLDGGRVTTAKVLTAAQQEESVLAAARAAGAVNVERFAHGTTVATNALLERKGARTAFVTTAGFEHLLHLRRQTRAHLYRPCAAWPEPLVPLERSPRCARADGPGRGARAARPRLAAGHRRRRSRGLPARTRTAIRAHERAVATSCGAGCPDAHVVASHEVAPEFREYERASTTAADAYLGPVVARYLRALAVARRRRRACPSRSSCARREESRRPTKRPRIRRRSSSRARRPASSAPRGSRRSPASRTRSRSTWAERRPTSA